MWPLPFLREKSSFHCRSGQLQTTSGSSVSSQSTSSPEAGPRRMASVLAPSTSCLLGPRSSSFSCSSKELTTTMGPEAGLGHEVSVVAEKSAVSNSSKCGERTSMRPRRTLLMSSGSTGHFSPDLRVAMTARAVELATSRSPWKLRASAKCRSPLRTSLILCLAE